MQQTDKYQFKLIEGTDAFSPQPLNENMEQVEQALTELESSLLGNLGTIGQNLRVEAGSYVGTGGYGESQPNTLTFQLHPVVVMVALTTAATGAPPMVLMRPAPSASCQLGGVAYGVFLTWGEHSVQWYVNGDGSAYHQGNSNGVTYHYIALGY